MHALVSFESYRRVLRITALLSRSVSLLYVCLARLRGHDAVLLRLPEVEQLGMEDLRLRRVEARLHAPLQVPQKCTSKCIGRQGIVLKPWNSSQKEPMPRRPMPVLAQLRVLDVGEDGVELVRLPLHDLAVLPWEMCLLFFIRERHTRRGASVREITQWRKKTPAGSALGDCPPKPGRSRSSLCALHGFCGELRRFLFLSMFHEAEVCKGLRGERIGLKSDTVFVCVVIALSALVKRLVGTFPGPPARAVEVVVELHRLVGRGAALVGAAALAEPEVDLALQGLVVAALRNAT